MKRLISVAVVTLIVFAIIVPAAMAQGQGQFTPPTPESRVQQLEAAIKLTPEQRTQILKIYSDASGQGMRGMGFGSQLPEAVQSVLTADQVKQYNAYVLKQSVDARIAQLHEAVTLTADQRTKVVPIIEKEITAQNELMATMRGQGQNADMQGMMDKMTALRDATTASLKSILTAEQMTKYNAMPAARGMGGMGGTRGNRGR